MSSSAQGPSNFGLRRAQGEQQRFREHTASQSPRAPIGHTHRNLPSSTQLTPLAARRPAPAQHPFKVRRVSPTEVRVSFGTVNNIPAEIGGEPLDADPAPVLEVTAGVAQVIYLEISVTLAATSTGYVYSFTTLVEGDIQVMAGGSLPADDGTGLFYIRVANISASGKISQVTLSSKGFRVIDNGTGDSKGKGEDWAA